MADEQAIEHYGCICGATLPDIKEFRAHLWNGAKKDGKGVHKSVGRVNPSSGEITMPPYNERTESQKRETYHAKRTTSTGKKGEVTVRGTEHVATATQIKFVPRVFTSDFTPIMRGALEASRNMWQWPDMPFEDFVDTVFHGYFKDRGITLAGYYIDEEMVRNRDDQIPLPAEPPGMEEIETGMEDPDGVIEEALAEAS